VAGGSGTGSGIGERLGGSTLLLTGATGFVGKAVLARMVELDCFGTALVLVRAADEAAARKRLQEEVLGSEALAGLSAAEMLAEGRIRAVAGDVESGGPPAGAEPAWGEVETVIHCAASVSFEDPLDEIMALNALGPLRLLESLRAAGSHPHFVHVSTAYAAECWQATVPEDGPLHPSLEGMEPEELLARACGWRAEANDGDRAALSRRGRRFALEAGWPDTYALTKALGERLLAEQAEHLTIVRPTIVESSLATPRPGWLEGIKVADPLILAYAAGGLTDLPGRAENPIDVVPVDLVANACLAAAAYPPSDGQRRIAIGSSARNALTLGGLAARIKAHFREQPLRRRNGAAIEIGELRFVDRKLALRRTMRREAMALAAARLGAVAPAGTQKKLRRNGKLAGQVTRMVKIYGPYTELSCRFDDANTRALAAEMSAEDRAALPFDTAAVDWDDYLLGNHLPQVHRMAEQR
jgi:nucleoside-diphosphate-sugar epimerase